MSLKTIPTVFISALIFIFIIQPHVMALTDMSSLQCDGGIVASGDSADSVKEKCGEPQQMLTPDPQEPVKWVYDLGGTYYVSIVNGKVERIQVGD
ncbi:MAG: DUF2845 domain-containing protein [Desulfobacterales bacterium]|jgi:hypothetical protein|nr:DUF2845 domain-containing protein [Desulfobacterales bacterium]